MSADTTPSTAGPAGITTPEATETTGRPGGAPAALLALTARSLRTCARTPSLILSPLLMSAFFLVVYEAQLSPVAGAAGAGRSYVEVVLPLCLLTTAFTGGAIAGQLLVRDIESGYHARLWLTPAGRSALVAAPVLAGTAVLAAQAAALTALGGLLGLRPAGGLAAAAAVVAATVLVGLGFLLLAAAAGLWTGSASAVSSVTLVFFPLSFFTATFVPRASLDGWMAVAAGLNPLTPPLEAMRALLSPGWREQSLWPGTMVVAALLLLGALAVRTALVRRTRTGV
ncbi:ABC transporter permease [Streptomyces albus]|uniref:ABC transporter permease n=1 Tax=Streptomyces albus TaxID=1888 RepID=UPI0004C8AC18|nr:ABC transporter permease [Streptomyces albus]